MYKNSDRFSVHKNSAKFSVYKNSARFSVYKNILRFSVYKNNNIYLKNIQLQMYNVKRKPSKIFRKKLIYYVSMESPVNKANCQLSVSVKRYVSYL